MEILWIIFETISSLHHIKHNLSIRKTKKKVMLPPYQSHTFYHCNVKYFSPLLCVLRCYIPETNSKEIFRTFTSRLILHHSDYTAKGTGINHSSLLFVHGSANRRKIGWYFKISRMIFGRFCHWRHMLPGDIAFGTMLEWNIKVVLFHFSKNSHEIRVRGNV